MIGKKQFNSAGIVASKSPRILRGSVAMGNIAKDTSATKTVTFSPAFGSTPYVFVSFYSGSTGWGFGKNTCAVQSVSTSQMVIRAFNGDDASARVPSVYWVAVEVI